MAITYHSGRRIQSTQNASQSTSSSGSSANATNGSNGFSAVTGLIGQGYSQSSGIYRIDTAPVLGTEWSFNFWTNPQTAIGNDYYLQMTADTSPRNSVFYIYNHNTDGLNMSVHDSTGTKVNISTDDSEMWVDMTNGSWNMITMTWNNTDKKLRSYKNGVLYETGKALTHTNAGNMGTSNKVWAIGNYDNQTGSTYASRANALDEWSFWSGTLSQADITELYNGGSGIKATALSSANKLKLNVYYDFEDTVNGTLTNQAPTTATIPDVKPTKTTPTFEDDFSSDNWTDNGATTHVTGGSLVWNSDTTDNGCSLDMLGSTISDTAWVARFKFTVANFDSGTGNHQFQFLVSDKANLDVATTSRDSLGFKIIKATSDEYALAWKNGGTISTNTEVAFAHSAQAETIYVEMSRLSSTSFKVEFFSDSSYTTSIESETATISGVVDLRYLIAIEQDINGSATMNGTINNFEFYNGHTSVSSNAVQAGSRYEETNTQKIYYMDDISWKELDGAEATNYRSESWYEQLTGETP